MSGSRVGLISGLEGFIYEPCIVLLSFFNSVASLNSVLSLTNPSILQGLALSDLLLFILPLLSLSLSLSLSQDL